MSPTMSVLLLIGNLSEIYCTSECLYTYSKYPQLNDSYDSQSPRATGHAGGRRALGTLRFSVAYAGNHVAELRQGQGFRITGSFTPLPHQGCGVTVLGSRLIPPHALHLHQSFMEKNSTPYLRSVWCPFLLANPCFTLSWLQKAAEHGSQGGWLWFHHSRAERTWVHHWVLQTPAFSPV